VSRIMLCSCLVLAFACGDPRTGGADADLSPVDTSRPDAPDADAPPAPTARVFRATDPAQLVGGPFARGEVGDFVLENDVARFVVRGSAEPAWWGPFGGNLIDADVRRPPGEEGHDVLGELIPIFGLIRAFRPSGFEVVDDGTGGSAVLRVTGTDAGIPMLDSAVPIKPLHLAVTIDYRLSPGQPWLEIRTTATNTGTDAVTVLMGLSPMWQDRLTTYYGGLGLEDEAPTVKSGMASEQALAHDVAYAIVAAPGQTLSAPVSIQGVEIVQAGKPTLAPGASETRSFFVAVSDGGGEALALAEAGIRGTPSPASVRGTITGLPPEVPARDVMLVVTDAAGDSVAATVPDATRAFSVGLAPGGLYAFEVRVDRLGAVRKEGVPVGEGGLSDLGLAGPPIGVLEVRCHPAGQPLVDLPCRAALQPGPAAALEAGPAAELFAGPGRHRFAVPPGAWTVTLSRGFAYELARPDVTVPEGGAAIAEGELVRSVDTGGWVDTVVHVHSEYSVDSDLPIDLRLYALAAAGMSYVYPTEHDVCLDYQPFIDRMGLADWLISDVGCEVSPMPGHFNCLGCTPTTAAFAVPFVAYAADGTIDHALQAPEIWQRMRDTLGAALIQINHPYSTQAFFASLGLAPGDPLQPLVGDKFSLAFDTLELQNSHDDANDLYQEILPTWYRMLNDGLRRTGVGAEDTHQAHGTGTPRTLVRTGGDDQPSIATPGAIAAALREGRAISVQGPLPELWLDGRPIGATVTPTAGEVSVRARVQAPSWMKLGSARLVRNGEVVETFDLTGAAGAVRLDTTLVLPEAGPAWYVLLVEGDAWPLAPLYGDPAFSITNPVFVAAE